MTGTGFVVVVVVSSDVVVSMMILVVVPGSSVESEGVSWARVVISSGNIVVSSMGVVVSLILRRSKGNESDSHCKTKNLDIKNLKLGRSVDTRCFNCWP